MLKKIVVKVNERELNEVKNVLRSYTESKPDVSISALRHGSLGDDELISFNVDEKHYDPLIEKLTLNGIKVLIAATKSEKEKIQTVIKKVSLNSNINQGNTKKFNVETPAAVLDGSIERGDYEKVIQISKDFRSGHELIKKAKENIEGTVNAAINLAFEKAAKSKFEINSSFNQLIKIASDKNLKAMHFINQQKTAGLYAVKLCSDHKEYLNLLIQICNNNSIPNIVCIKASVELSSMVLNEQGGGEDIEYAVRYLNIKWLQIALDVAVNEVNQKEKESVKDLISAVRKIRNDRNQQS